MKKLYYLYFSIISLSTMFLTGCLFLVPQKQVKQESYIIDVADLNDSDFNEAVTVYGQTDPGLKISLVASFEATVTTKNCFKRLNNGWPSFVKYTIVNSSYKKEEFNLKVPIEWNNSFGRTECKFELEDVYLQVSYPTDDKKYIDEPLDLLMGANNDSYFRIDGKTYYNLARDYKVRYLTGLSSLNCIFSKNSDPRFYCNSGLNVSAIKKSDFLPSSLRYGVNIFLQIRK